MATYVNKLHVSIKFYIKASWGFEHTTDDSWVTSTSCLVRVSRPSCLAYRFQPKAPQSLQIWRLSENSNLETKLKTHVASQNYQTNVYNQVGIVCLFVCLFGPRCRPHCYTSHQFSRWPQAAPPHQTPPQELRSLPSNSWPSWDHPSTCMGVLWWI